MDQRLAEMVGTDRPGPIRRAADAAQYRVQYARCSPASCTGKTHSVRVGGYRHHITLRHHAGNTTYRLRLIGPNKRGYGHPHTSSVPTWADSIRRAEP